MSEETVEEPRASGWKEKTYNEGSFVNRHRGVLAGLGGGIVGGMGAFMFSVNEVAPQVVGFLAPGDWGLVVTIFAGVFTFLLADDARESVKAMLVGFFVGMIVLTIAHTAPAWVLPYEPFQRDLIIKEELKGVIDTTLKVLIFGYWGAYLGAITLFGYFDL